jgi:hypothetical protein
MQRQALGAEDGSNLVHERLGHLVDARRLGESGGQVKKVEEGARAGWRGGHGVLGWLVLAVGGVFRLDAHADARDVRVEQR